MWEPQISSWVLDERPEIVRLASCDHSVASGWYNENKHILSLVSSAKWKALHQAMTSEALKADKQLFLHLHPSARTSRMRLSSIPFSWYLLLTLLPAVDDKASSCQWDPPMETFLCWDLFAGSDWANPLLVLARGMLCQSLSKPSLFTCLTGGPTIVLDKSVLPAVAGPLATVTGSSCHERFGCGEPTKGNTFQSTLTDHVPWPGENFQQQQEGNLFCFAQIPP